MTDLVALKQANAKRWQNAKILRPGTFKAVATHLVAPVAKQRYQAVSAQLAKMDYTVPWFVIAVIHERECSQDWSGSLAQGDPWNRVSVNVPKGRGPFKSWEEAAIDALVNCAPYAARNRDWSIGGTLTKVQEYNGLGYGEKPSPYIWAGTDQYVKGKFIRDHVYDPEAVDTQLGCAGLLMAMMAIDPTITFTGVVLTPAKPVPAPKPSAGKKTTGAIVAGGGAIVAAHQAGFGIGAIVAIGIIAAAIAFAVWHFTRK